MAKYLSTIGIETHVQLNTATKLFCRCQNASAALGTGGATAEEPNVNICPVCLGLPGALPYLNQAAIELAIKVGLALNAKIAGETKFDRKHYFYPDLPKGYQISQYDQPLVGQGRVEVPLGDRSLEIGITRAHLEEDAGKSTHPEGQDYTLVDLNRTGTPLMEIVSEPNLKSPAEAKAFVQELYLLMRYAGVSEVDLYRGNMRFDVNISVAKLGQKELGLRTEIKNLNSFKAVERASAFEVARQTALLEKGERPSQDTRGWDEAKGKTFALRSKEGEADYRYFPEPDLPPLVITAAMVKQAQASLPPLPAQIRQQLTAAGLAHDEAETLLLEPRLIAIFLAAAKAAKPAEAKRIANWLRRDVKALSTQPGFNWQKLTLNPERLIKLAKLVEAGQLSSNAAEQVLENIIKTDADPEAVAKRLKLLQVSDNKTIGHLIAKVVAANPEAAADYQAGNQRSLQFLVGQVMRESQGSANPELATRLLQQKLA